MNLKNLEDDQLIELYPRLLQELKTRKIIRTNNLVGELGEYIAVSHYKKDPKLPKLQLNLNSTKNIDAVSVKGERYAFKSLTGSGTGVFASLPLEDDGKVHFEFLILVIFDKDYILNRIFELTWKDFLKFRKIKTPENKWNLPITNKLKGQVRKIY